jgi:hypothetical protein
MRLKTALAAAGMVLGSWLTVRVVAQVATPESAPAGNEVTIDFLSDLRGELDPCG